MWALASEFAWGFTTQLSPLSWNSHRELGGGWGVTAAWEPGLPCSLGLWERDDLQMGLEHSLQVCKEPKENRQTQGPKSSSSTF